MQQRSHSQKYRLLAIDAHNSLKGLFQTQIGRSDIIQHTTCVSSAEELERTLRDAEAFDVVCLSSSFGTEEMLVIRHLLASNYATEQACLIQIEAQELTRRNLVTRLLEGFDAVLLAPFSVDTFIEVIQLALHTSLTRDEARAEQLVGMLARETRAVQGELSVKRSKGLSARLSLRVANQLSLSIRELPDQLRALFLDKIVESYLSKQGIPVQVSEQVPLSERLSAHSSQAATA